MLAADDDVEQVAELGFMYHLLLFDTAHGASGMRLCFFQKDSRGGAKQNVHFVFKVQFRKVYKTDITAFTHIYPPPFLGQVSGGAFVR